MQTPRPSVLACITSQYDCDRIIEAAKQFAEEEDLELRVLSVLRPTTNYALISDQLEYLNLVSKKAGADMTVIFSDNAPKAAADFATESEAARIVTGMHDGGKESFLVMFNRLAPTVSISMVDKDRNVYSMNVRCHAR